jgi:hypothetical protein
LMLCVQTAGKHIRTIPPRFAKPVAAQADPFCYRSVAVG